MLFDSKAKGKHSTDQKDDDSGILESFKDKGKKTFGWRLGEHVGTKNSFSAINISIVFAYATLEIGFKKCSEFFDVSKLVMESLVAYHVTEKFGINVGKIVTWGRHVVDQHCEEVGEGREEDWGFYMNSFLDEGNGGERHWPPFLACDGVRTVWSSHHDKIWSRTNRKEKQFRV